MSNKKSKVKISVADLIKPPKKYLYTCHCINCRGAKVDSRTQKKHTKKESLWKSKSSRKSQENAIAARKQKNSITSNVNPAETNSSKKRKRDDNHDALNHTSNTSPNNENNEVNVPALLSSKPKTSSCFHTPAPNLIEDENNDDDGYHPDDDDDDPDNYLDDDNFDDNFEKDREEDFDDDNFEEDREEDREEDFFASPDITDISDEIFVMEELNDSIHSEIIIWIFKFQ